MKRLCFYCRNNPFITLSQHGGLHHHFQDHIDESVELTGMEELSDDEQMSLDFGKKEDE